MQIVLSVASYHFFKVLQQKIVKQMSVCCILSENCLHINISPCTMSKPTVSLLLISRDRTNIITNPKLNFIDKAINQIIWQMD